MSQSIGFTGEIPQGIDVSVTTDLVVYSGAVNMAGYHLVCDALQTKKSAKTLLVLATPGGDPHAGFRIARALQHGYESFDALVPRYCKSAGTLILIGASKLYLDDMSELGPLDVQVKKGDELIGRNSGLDIFQAVNYLQNQSMAAFRNYLLELTRDAGLSTRVASEIASGLTSGLFEPIAAQIDPIKLAEMQRATEIAFEYGNRLNEKSGNLRAMGLARLVTGYPSHSFVIDRKEARQIFIRVERPGGLLAQASIALRAEMEKNIDSATPSVQLLTMPIGIEETTNVDASNAGNGAASAQGGVEEVSPNRSSSEQSEGAGASPDGAGPATEPDGQAPAGAAPQVRVVGGAKS